MKNCNRALSMLQSEDNHEGGSHGLDTFFGLSVPRCPRPCQLQCDSVITFEIRSQQSQQFAFLLTYVSAYQDFRVKLLEQKCNKIV